MIWLRRRRAVGGQEKLLQYDRPTHGIEMLQQPFEGSDVELWRDNCALAASRRYV